MIDYMRLVWDRESDVVMISFAVLVHKSCEGAFLPLLVFFETYQLPIWVTFFKCRIVLMWSQSSVINTTPAVATVRYLYAE